jgi:hypothetical protein
MGEWRCNFTFLDRGTRWSLVVSFMPLSLYFWGDNSQYTLGRGWVGPRASLDAIEKSLASAYNRTSAVQPVARRYIERTLPCDLIIMRDSSSSVELILNFFLNERYDKCSTPET